MPGYTVNLGPIGKACEQQTDDDPGGVVNPAEAGCDSAESNDLNKLQIRTDKGEVWYWQGDGYDFPDSINCPVIMQAQTLRKLLAGCDSAKESAEPEEWIEQAAKMIDEWFIQKNFNYTANTRAMIADIIRRKWYAQKGK